MKSTQVTIKKMSPWSVAIGSIVFLLSACGDESAVENVTQVNQSDIEVVSDVSKLPKCEDDNAGEMVWVKGEITPRMCSDSKWYAVAEGSVAATCSAEALPDGSGSKILCGGDSIGVVYNGRNGKDANQEEKDEAGVKDDVSENEGSAINGKDGADGKDGASCFMEKISESYARIICGDDSTTLYVGESPDSMIQGEIVLDSEKIAISLDQVSGMTQKGPFLSGSKVIVREMKDGRTLAQTGNAFNGKILNDKGEFKINARTLVSQYVILEATGYYRNEVTGENSSSELTLFAITDVSDRDIVNVNLLTHLEYERVVYLVTQKKMKVKAAKKQAQKEVFGLLSIDATNFSNSEDLNLMGASDEDAALLAFSAVLQGDRSVAELSEFLTEMATDMEKDGRWDDTTTRNTVADWAFESDSSGRLAAIRENVLNWKISAMVPDFEKYVSHFWITEYGLDSCNAKKLGEVVPATRGNRKNSGSRFICKETDDNKGYRWFSAEDVEKDTYGWKDSTDGALKKGDVTGKYYVFDSTGSNGDKGWRLADRTEESYGGCSKANYGKIVESQWFGGYYQCQEATHRWEEIGYKEHLIIDTYLWEERDDGFAKWGEVWTVWGVSKQSCYVYDTSAAYKGWREGTEYDCTLGLMGCTEGRLGLMRKTSDGAFYTCTKENGWHGDDYYENGYVWTSVDNTVAINTDGWACLDSNDGEMRKGQESDAYFVCEDNAWRDATTTEERDCRTDGVCQVHNCTEGKKGKFEDREGVAYVCDATGIWSEPYKWRVANCAEIKMKSVCTANDSTVIWDCEDVGNFKMDYICSHNSWHAVQSPYEYTLADWEKKKAKYYTKEMHPDAEYGEDLVDARDGTVYKTVVIGGKRWMAENLRYADSRANMNLKSQIVCSSDEDKYCKIGGVRYYWAAAMNLDPKWNGDTVGVLVTLPHRGICPEGWHIPDTTEWKTLGNAAGYASLQMKGFANWTEATDASGFSAMPDEEGGDAYFWSAEDFVNNYRDGNAYYWGVYANKIALGNWWSSSPKDTYKPVRCVENDSVEP